MSPISDVLNSRDLRMDNAVGQPFLRNLPLTTPENYLRCTTYLELQMKVSKLLLRAIRAIHDDFGMKREDDWVPFVIEDMRLKAQAKKNPGA